jgi:hypothetical protein
MIANNPIASVTAAWRRRANGIANEQVSTVRGLLTARACRIRAVPARDLRPDLHDIRTATRPVVLRVNGRESATGCRAERRARRWPHREVPALLPVVNSRIQSVFIRVSFLPPLTIVLPELRFGTGSKVMSRVASWD